MSDLGYLALGFGLLAVYLAAMAAVLFGAAGTLSVPMFWAYLALFAVMCVGASAAVYLQSPDLVKERLRPGEGEQDRVLVRALNLLIFVQLLLAGLDVRAAALVRHRSARAADPWAGRVRDGHGIYNLGHAGQPFLLAGVRLQPDRGQQELRRDPTGSCATPATRVGCCCC